MDEKKYPKKIEFNPQNVKKGGQNGGTSISPNIEGVPSPGYIQGLKLYHMSIMMSQITGNLSVCSTDYSLQANNKKHKKSTCLSLCEGTTRDWWIPLTKGQSCGKGFHVMASSCYKAYLPQDAYNMQQ